MEHRNWSTIYAGLSLSGITLIALYKIYLKNQETNDNETNETNDVILNLIRKNIRELKPYRCARDDYDTGLLLDANENSYGPPQGKKNDNHHLERYPCPYQTILKESISTWRGVSTQHLFLGVGSDEAIDLLIRVTCTPSSCESILITPPTYGMYSVCAQVNDVTCHEVPLTSSFQLQVQKVFCMLIILLHFIIMYV